MIVKIPSIEEFDKIIPVNPPILNKNTNPQERFLSKNLFFKLNMKGFKQKTLVNQKFL